MNSKRLSQSLQKAILFFGPTGMFFIPFPFIGSLRLFYILCVPFIFISLANLPTKIQLRFSLLIFVFITMYTSASYGMLSASALTSPSSSSIGLAGNPLVRVAVIGVLMLSFFLIANNFSRQANAGVVVDQISLSFWGFVIVFFLGTALYIGVLLGAIPQSFYTHSVSLEQRGYGYLRLSPGTYPNEFGILCSFYAVVALIRYGRSAKIYNVLFAMLFVAGVLLTSTRTAYVTFAFGYLTAIVLFPSWKVKIKFIIALLLAIPLVLYGFSLFSFDVIRLIESGYSSAISDQGSVAQRTADWKAALFYFYNHFWLGSGFASEESRFLHNLPLQMLAGLGAFGLTVVASLFFVFGFVQKNNPSFVIFSESSYERRYLNLIRIVLAEHVFLFALTNHNQAHFLTWLLFAVLCLKVRNAYDFLAYEKNNGLNASHSFWNLGSFKIRYFLSAQRILSV